jgi:hypothetical protein
MRRRRGLDALLDGEERQRIFVVDAVASRTAMQT